METAKRTKAARRSPVAAANRIPVRMLMTTPAVTVRPELTLDSLRDLLLRQGLSRVVVVDGAGRAVGMVSLTDLVVEEHQRGDDGERPRRAEERALPRGFHVESAEKTVGDVMSPKALTLAETVTVAQAAETLVAHHLHGAPVCSKSGVVIGFVSSTDLLSWLAGLR